MAALAGAGERKVGPMVVSSTLEEIAVRFAPYIEELHGFFVSRGVPFGSPEDIFGLAERLSDQSPFRDKLSSLVRAVIYREHEEISPMDLLEFVALATGGPKLNLSAPELQEPVRQLVAFLAEVRRHLWTSPPGPPVVSANAPDAPEGFRTEIPVASFEAPIVSEGAGATPGRIPTPLTVTALAPLSSACGPLFASVPAQDDSGGVSRAKNRMFWIVGLCGVLLGLAAGLLIRDLAPYGSAPTARNLQPAGSPIAGGSQHGRRSTSLRSTAKAVRPPRGSRQAGRESSLATRVPQRAVRTPAGAFTPAPPQIPSSPAVPRPVHLSAPERLSSHPEANLSSAASTSSGAPAVLYPGDYPGQPEAVNFARHGSVFLSSSGVMAAYLLSAPAPAYPPAAISAEVQGQVVIQAVVGKDGEVTAPRVVSGPPLLRDAALEAVRRWQYRPYLVYGQPAEIVTTAMVEFRLSR